MSTVALEPRLTESEWVRQNRAEFQVKDKTYRRYPIGQEVGHFLRAKRVGRRTQSTIDAYETVLRLLTLDHRDFDSLEHFNGPEGTDYLYTFLDKYWGDAADATMEQRIRILHSFGKWAELVGKTSKNFARHIEIQPRKEQVARRTWALAEIRRIASAQETTRDEAGFLLLGRLALRKNDLRELQLRDIDLARDLIFIKQGKGKQPAELPIVFDDVHTALYLHLQERGGGPDEYLIYPRNHRLRPMDPASLHRWFKRCLARAGAEDFKMHELRHSAADHLWRRSRDLMAASKLLRHKSVRTTERYLHPTQEDLIEAMRKAED
jgi:integrase